MSRHSDYRGWTRPGPMPPAGVDPEEGETLDYFAGNFRIFQLAAGHRYSTDDVVAAWYGTICAPRVERAADLGSGIGSLAMLAAWRLPAARFWTVEAQETSLRLARKSVVYNGLESRFTLRQGDLRDGSILADAAPFDLVLGSPPYFPRGTATEAAHSQATAARVELRGGVEDYAAAAARLLAPGAVFAFVFPANQRSRAHDALERAALTLVRTRDVVFKEGEPPMIALFAATPRSDLPATYTTFVEPPLVIRTRDGSTPPEYAAIRLSFGFPPGNTPPA